jgi:putative ABC transport system ATP-binding protein
VTVHGERFTKAGRKGDSVILRVPADNRSPLTDISLFEPPPPVQPMALVEIRDVDKSFKREAQTVDVYNGLTIDFEEGSFSALMGPSGSGKSTLLNLVAGLDKPTRGTVRVAGAEVSAMNAAQLAAWRARTIGFVFQSYNLLPVLTAQQNVELPLLLTNLGKRERAERTAIALGVVGLQDRMDHFPRQLSGGQEQRVAIARAIVADPTLILLDEPTGQLDSKSSDEVLELLRRLNEEFRKTIMMVTHDAKAAASAKTVLHLEKGVLLERVASVKAGGGIAPLDGVEVTR